MIKSTLGWAAIVLGLISAYWWYVASVSRVTRDNNTRYNLNDDVEVRSDDGSQSLFLIATAREQGRLNKIAATCTAASLGCQALASAVPESWP